MRAMNSENTVKQARNFIENKLIPQVKTFQQVTLSFADFIKDGMDRLIDVVLGLVREYGLCLKLCFGQGQSTYQFWYETE